jgi:hypothetical protein
MIKMFAMVTTLFLLGGCATFADTPAQTRTWERLRTCQAKNPSISLGSIHVLADGSWRTYGAEASIRPLAQCMGGRFG